MDEEESGNTGTTVAWGGFIALWLGGLILILTLTPHAVRCLQADNRLAWVAVQNAAVYFYALIGRVDQWLVLAVYALACLVLVVVAYEIAHVMRKGMAL